MSIYKLFIIFASALVFTGLTTSVAFAQNPDNGKVVWEEQVWQCQQCHGPNGEGKWVRPLSNSTATAQEWIEQVRNPRRFMPKFSEEQVSDEQIIDMHAYVTSLPAPAADFMPQDAGTFDNPGQNLMAQKRCIACHEDEVTTGQGQRIEEFVSAGVTPTADVVITQLRTPRRNMPAFSADQVSDDEAALIADFLAAQVQAQSPPAALPQAGQGGWPNLPVILALFGSGLVLSGLVLYVIRAVSRA